MNEVKPIEDVVKDQRYHVEYLETPVKSENDKKEYRAIRLQNGFEILLISDAHLKTSHDQDKNNEEKAAYALSVGVGTFSDPLQIPIIGIFFSYMLFRGTKEHSHEDSFQTFIRKLDGYNNTSVDYDYTIFNIRIQEKVLFQALRRLAQFCLTPLSNIDLILQNPAAIKHEFQKAIHFMRHQRDPLLYSFVEIGHPANKFIVDYLELKDDINNKNLNKWALYKMLQKFTKRHYSAHRMKLVVQSGLSLSTMEKFVTQCFANVPTNRLPPDNFTKFKDILPFDTPAFRKMYKVNDFSKHDRELVITWVVPSLLYLYKSKPYKYISQIIEHEGKGSLISYLRKNMWSCINSNVPLQCKIKHCSTFSLVKLIVKLSYEGQQHREKILDAIFSFINLLRKEGPQKRLYDEFYKNEQISFRYDVDKDDQMDYVAALCTNMHFYPSCHYLIGNKLYFEYNPEDIQKYLNYLIPETANIMIFDNDFECHELNKIHWSNSIYADIEISREWIERWKSIEPLGDFNLPFPNIFIPKDFTSIAVPMEYLKYPVQLLNNHLMEIWYRPDTKLPKCHINLHLVSPLVLESPKNAAFVDVYCDVLKFLLMEQLYPARTAGIDYKIIVTEKGIAMKIYGFNEKLPLLLKVIAEYINIYPLTEDLFESFKKRQIEIHYDEFEPWDLVNDIRLWILKLVHYTHLDKYAVLHTATNFKDFQFFVNSFTDHLYVQCLVQGNMSQDTVTSTMEQFVNIINCKSLPTNMRHYERITQISLGTTRWMLKSFKRFDFGRNGPSSALGCYYQVGAIMSIKLSMIIELMAITIMELSLFDKLEQTFGDQLNTVWCYLQNDNGILGFYITTDIFTNDRLETVQMEQQIDEFLKSFNKILTRFSEEELDRIKDKRRLSKSKHSCVNNFKQVESDWNEIIERKYMFDRFEREELALKEIKVNDVKEFVVKYILDKNNIRKLSIHMIENIPEDCDNETENYMDIIAENRKKEQLRIAKDITCNQLYQNVKDYKKQLYLYPVSTGCL